MAVDPLAVLFPSISPFVYGHSNPLRVVDRNGMADTTIEGVFMPHFIDDWTDARTVGQPILGGNDAPESMLPIPCHSTHANSHQGNVDFMFPILSVGKANDAGKLSLLRGGMWKGANGKWYSLSWGGNGSKGGRTLVISEAETFGAIGDAMSVVEGSVALNNLIDALGQGNNNAAIRAASDLAAVFVGAAGGSIGLIVATGYGVVMNIRDHTIDYVSPPYDSPVRCLGGYQIFPTEHP
jgi:hypothetical protein